MEDVTIEQNIPSSFKMLRNFFNWSYENPEIINPNITSIYVFILDHHSRLGFKEKFGLPTTMTMEAVGIHNYKTYKKAIDILVEYGFIEVVEWSKNQYSSNVVALVKNTKAHTKALSKASTKHSTKHVESIASIDKLKNLRTKEYISFSEKFELVWSNYGKIGSKKKAYQIWEKMDEQKRANIEMSIAGYKNSLAKTGYAPKHFTSYLNSDEYENYLNISTSSSGEIKVQEVTILPTLENNFEFSLLNKIRALPSRDKASLFQFIAENRQECSAVYQITRRYDGKEHDAYYFLPEHHPLKKFIKLYSHYVETNNK